GGGGGGGVGGVGWGGGGGGAGAGGTGFLPRHERGVAEDAQRAVTRGADDVAALRARQADVAWGTRAADAEERERLRQFTLGREELVAGDRMVLRTLRARARERQRLWLGGPGGRIGGAAAGLAVRARRRV